MARVIWSNAVGGCPRVSDKKSVPKKPMRWWGEVWLLMPDGFKHVRKWRARQPITRQQGQEVLAIMLDELIDECGKDAAIDSGFLMECR
jgi:hypothetical protein